VSEPSVADIAALVTYPPLEYLDVDKALRSYENGIRERFDAGALDLVPVRPEPITDVTLSGAQMNAGSAWLQLDGCGLTVDGHTGQIHWDYRGEPVGYLNFNPSLMIVWLLGVEPGETYVGQIRGFARQASQKEYYYISLEVIYPDRTELSTVQLATSRFIVPFALIDVPQVGGRRPSVWFRPGNFSECVVYDVNIKRV
jgi:hypothetical protein